MKHTVVIEEESKCLLMEQIPGRFYTDGAIGGNGDIQLVLGGTVSQLSVFMNKADFWKAREGEGTGVGVNGGPRNIARLDIHFSHEKDCTYYVEERMEEGELYAKMGEYELTLTPCATDNIVLAKFSYPAYRQAPVMKVCECPGNESRTNSGEQDDVGFVERCFENDAFYFNSYGIVTYKLIEETKKNETNTKLYAFCMATNHDMAAYHSYALRTMHELTAENCRELYSSHYAWWDSFWRQSKVTMSDEELELNWYWGIYVMACCARNKQFPPGVMGAFVTSDDVAWNGDYHANYNYQAPFYPLVASNHVELMECYDAGYQYFIPQGKQFAKEFLGCRGVYFPVGIGPLGYNPSKWDECLEHGYKFLGQKSNAIHLTVVVAMRWYGTLDVEYAKRVYPYMLEVAKFWEDYLVYEDGRYVVINDAIHEVDFWRKEFDPQRDENHSDDKNSILTLGLLRMFFTCLLDMCERLNNENKRNQKWEHILTHLSPYATFERDGKKTFRYTETGMDWNRTNSLCIQHIYPCNAVDLSNDEMYHLSVETFSFEPRWVDNNAYSSYYPCAARLGVKPQEILYHMKNQFRDFQFPSKMFFLFGGWLENTSATTNVLNEMMLQSYDGILRVFPCFPHEMDCQFEKLRARGAFLVSSEQKNGNIVEVIIVSERGGTLNIKNPYSCAKVSVGTNEWVCEDEIIVLDTKLGETVKIVSVHDEFKTS